MQVHVFVRIGLALAELSQATLITRGSHRGGKRQNNTAAAVFFAQPSAIRGLVVVVVVVVTRDGGGWGHASGCWRLEALHTLALAAHTQQTSQPAAASFLNKGTTTWCTDAGDKRAVASQSIKKKPLRLPTAFFAHEG